MDKFKRYLFVFIIFGVFNQFCCYASELGPKAIVSEIEKSYEHLSDVKARIKEENYSQESKIEVNGILQFKTPDKIKIDFELISENGKYRAKNMLVYNGSVLWQEQLNPDSKKISVFKSELKNSSVQAQEIMKQFNPKQQFADFIAQYDVVDVKVVNDENASVYVLDMDIKTAARERMVQMFKAKGQQQADLMVPEKVFFYWNRKKEFAVKIETQSKNQEYKTLIEYSDISIDLGIKDAVFAYVPAAGIEVIDMSNINNQEAGRREFEGAENKLVGRVFPYFDLNDVFNDKYASQDLKGKIAIVNFWEHWCPPCIKELPLIENLYQDIYTEDYVRIITVTSNKDKALELVEENSYSFPVLIDSKAELAGQLGVDSIPRTFVVDKQGLIAAVYMGYHSDIEQMLKADINRLNPEE